MNVQEHLLACLAEECGEVILAVGKALRFGLDDGYPDSGRTNAEDIVTELLHVKAVAELLNDEGLPLLDCQSLRKLANQWKLVNQKKEAVRKFMEYAKDRGTLVVKERP